MQKPLFQYGLEQFNYDILGEDTLNAKVRIHILPNGTIRVKAPLDSERRLIRNAVLKRAWWIKKHCDSIKETKAYVLLRHYASGETHFCLGRRYVLKVFQTDSIKPEIKLQRGSFIFTGRDAGSAVVKKNLDLWYKSHAATYFTKRLNELSAKVSLVVTPPELKLQRMQTHWGSCSPNGRVLLNPSLIKASRDCIDYVVLHELCHLKEHNHSPQFYELLDSMMPERRSIKTKRDEQAELILID